MTEGNVPYTNIKNYTEYKKITPSMDDVKDIPEDEPIEEDAD